MLWQAIVKCLFDVINNPFVHINVQLKIKIFAYLLQIYNKISIIKRKPSKKFCKTKESEVTRNSLTNLFKRNMWNVERKTVVGECL